MRSIPREAVEVSDPQKKNPILHSKTTENEPANFGANAVVGFWIHELVAYRSQIMKEDKPRQFRTIALSHTCGPDARGRGVFHATSMQME
jgi:hypothetical protein